MPSKSEKHEHGGYPRFWDLFLPGTGEAEKGYLHFTLGQGTPPK